MIPGVRAIVWLPEPTVWPEEPEERADARIGRARVVQREQCRSGGRGLAGRPPGVRGDGRVDARDDSRRLGGFCLTRLRRTLEPALVRQRILPSPPVRAAV